LSSFDIETEEVAEVRANILEGLIISTCLPLLGEEEEEVTETALLLVTVVLAAVLLLL
jgi:hypothetical protein